MAGLGNRGQIREELPLSTRIHELAKELGLKSQELIERIQKWGLDVKANALASLDPPLVDKIRELMDQPASETEATSLATTSIGPRRPPPTASPRDHDGRKSDRGTLAPRPDGRASPARPDAATRPGRPRRGQPRTRRHRDRGPAALDPGLIAVRIGPTPGIERHRQRPSHAPGGPRPAARVRSAAPCLAPAAFPELGPPAAPFRPIRRIGGRPLGRAGSRVSRTSPATRAQAGQPSSPPFRRRVRDHPAFNP